ncbi:MAG: biotin/lipoyl-containing protein, partial [Marinilabilia sp.]
VEEQIKVAMGLPLGFSQDELAMNGHAIEARIYVEDALKEFRPSPGTIHFVKWPDERAVRTDTFFTGKTEILPDFDPMLAKIIAHGPTREGARKKLSGSLEATAVLGITTNLPYLIHLIKKQAFVNGDTTTHFSGIHQEMLYRAIQPNGPEKTNLLMAAYAVWLTRYRVEQSNTVWTRLGHYRWNNNFKAKVNDDDFTIRIRRHSSAGNLSWSLNHKEMPDIENIRFSEHDITFTFNQKVRQFNWFYTGDKKLLLGTDGYTYVLTPGHYLDPQKQSNRESSANDGKLTAPLPGKVIRIHVLPGDHIEKDSPVLTIETMKMENTILAPVGGIIKTFNIREGEQISAGQVLAGIEDATPKERPSPQKNNH